MNRKSFLFESHTEQVSSLRHWPALQTFKAICNIPHTIIHNTFLPVTQNILSLSSYKCHFVMWILIYSLDITLSQFHYFGFLKKPFANCREKGDVSLEAKADRFLRSQGGTRGVLPPAVMFPVAWLCLSLCPHCLPLLAPLAVPLLCLLPAAEPERRPACRRKTRREAERRGGSHRHTPGHPAAVSQRPDRAADDKFQTHFLGRNPGSPTHCRDNLAKASRLRASVTSSVNQE